MEIIELNLGRFKRLKDVILSFGPGINVVEGSKGKFILIHALELLRSLALGWPKDFLEQYDLEPEALAPEDDPTLRLGIVFRAGDRYFDWTIHWNTGTGRTVFENVRDGPSADSLRNLMLFDRGHLQIWERDRAFERDFSQLSFRGSILDILRPVDFPTYVAVRDNIRSWAKRISNLGVLDPRLLARCSNRHGKQTIGWKGQGFTGFLATFPPKRKAQFTERVKRCFPNFTGFRVKSLSHCLVTVTLSKGKRKWFPDQCGWDELRMLAMEAMPELSASLLILEEVENGIDHNLIPQVFQNLNEAPFQVLVTTSNPAVLPRP